MNTTKNFFKQLSQNNKEARALGYKWIDLIKRESRQKIINEIKTQREIKIIIKNLIKNKKKWYNEFRKRDFKIIKKKKGFQ